MFEKEGFCPNNSFLQYQLSGEYDISPLWNRTEKILGDRKAYMVYSKAGVSFKGVCYIVDALEGAKGTLGIEVASILKRLIPNCKYGEIGKKIICTDLINPYQMPVKIYENYDKECGWGISADENLNKNALVEDERYLILIKDEEEVIRIYLYQK